MKNIMAKLVILMLLGWTGSFSIPSVSNERAKPKKCKRPVGNVGQSAVCSSKGKWVPQPQGDSEVKHIVEENQELIRENQELLKYLVNITGPTGDVIAWGEDFCTCPNRWTEVEGKECPIGMYGPINVLTNEEDIRVDYPTNPSTPNYWLAGEGKTGENARLYMYLGGTKTISGFYIKNTHNFISNDRGTENFAISIGTSADPLGAWTPVLTGTLLDARGVSPVPVETFTLTPAQSAKFIRFEITSFYGTSGGGLQYLSTF